MSILARIASFRAPKTQDAEYDAAAAVYATFSIDESRIEGNLQDLVQQITRLSAACVKLAGATVTYFATGAPTDLQDRAARAAEQARSLDSLTGAFLAPRVAAHFIAPLREYDASVAAVHRRKRDRSNALRQFDKQREYVRQIESSKKTKREQLDHARAKRDELKGKYDPINSEWIALVHEFAETRRRTLGDPYRACAALFCQFARRANGRTGGAAAPKRVEQRPTADEAPKKATQTVHRRVVRSAWDDGDDAFINPFYAGCAPEDLGDGWGRFFNPVRR
jgi:hypothetical protein